MKRILSLILTICMLLSVFPANPVFADEVETEAEAAAEVSVEAPAQEEPAEAPAPKKEEKPAEAPASKAEEEKSAEEPAPKAEEKPAEEQPVEAQEEPAEEQPVEAQEEPAEEQPAEAQEEPAEEQPVEAQEEPAAEQPVEAQEEPAAEQPVEAQDKPAEELRKPFSEGYALAKKDTSAYSNGQFGEKLGSLKEDAVVYATELNENETALHVLFAVDGEVQSAWLPAKDVIPLTDGEIASHLKEIPDAVQGEIKLLNAPFVPVETVPAEGEETAEQPASEGETAETPAEGNSEAETLAEDVTETAEQPAAEGEATEASAEIGAETAEQPASEGEIMETPAEGNSEADTFAADEVKTAEQPASEAATETLTESAEESAEQPIAEDEVTEAPAETEKAEPEELKAIPIVLDSNPDEDPDEDDEEEIEEEEVTDPDEEEISTEDVPEPEADTPEVVKAGISTPDYFDIRSADNQTLVIQPRWHAVKGLVYEIQRKEESGKWTILGGFTAEDDTYYYTEDTDVKPGNAYRYRIRAWDSGITVYSKWAYTSVFLAEAITVSNTVSEKTAYPKVTWNKVNRATGYYIYRWTYNFYTQSWSDAPKLVKKISGNKTFSYTDKNVTVNRAYQYDVYPIRTAAGKTMKSLNPGYTVALVRPMSGIPQNLTVSQEKTGVQLTWNAVDGATGYQIYYTNNPYAAKPTWKKAGSTTKTTYTYKDGMKASKSGKYRQYKVYPTAKINGTAKKGPAATSEIICRLGSPTAKVSRGKDEDTLNVSWTKVVGADEYRIYWKLDEETDYHWGTVDGSYTSCVLTNSLGITGTKKHQVYVQPVSNNNTTGVTQVGSRSAIKAITPVWTYVVIVGNYDYPGTSEDLWGIKYDITGMANVFKKRGAVKVTTGKNTTAYGFKSLISSGFSSAGKNSVCVLVYAGHGANGYGWPCFPGGSYITSSELKNYLDANVKSQHVVFIHQACSSGGLIGKGEETEEDIKAKEKAMVNAMIAPFVNASKNGEFAGTKYSVIAAAKCNTSSWTVWEWVGRSSNIVNGFSPMLRFLATSGGYDYYTKSSSGRKGDSDKNGKVSVLEAFNYASSRMNSFVWYGSKKYRSTMVYYSPEPNLPLF